MSERPHDTETAEILDIVDQAALYWDARDAVWDSMSAVLSEDVIRPEEYDALMAPWREVMGDE